MGWKDEFEDAVREKFGIPEGADIIIDEEIGMGGYACCGEYPEVEVQIYWTHIPEGKKRKKKSYATYPGTVFQMFRELEDTP